MSDSNRQTSVSDFSLYPLLWLGGCFALGILAANFQPLVFGFSLPICLICIAATLVFMKHRFALIFLSIAFASAGCVTLSLETYSISPSRLKRIYDESRINSGDPVEIEGYLKGKPELSVGGIFLTLETEIVIYKGVEQKVSGIVRLSADVSDEQIKREFEQLNLTDGSRLRVACRLRREENFLNPGVISQKEILDQKNIDATGIIKSPLLIENFGEEKNLAPFERLYDLRESLILKFNNYFSVSTSGVLIASLLGNGNFLDKRTAGTFREGGTFHVLVISGLHITFIGGLVLLFVRFFTKNKLWQFIAASIFLWSYAIMVGANVPVVRAALMFTILLFSQVIYRRGTLLNALGFCAVVLLVWRPSDLFSQSFQLTFLSVAAIVAIAFPLIEKLRSIGDWSPSAENPFPPDVSRFVKEFCELLYWREPVWQREVSRQIWSANLFKSSGFLWLARNNLQNSIRFVFEAVLISFVAQICLLPLIIVYFHRVSLFGVFFNLWVGIFIALESFSAFFTIFLGVFSDALAMPFVKLTELFNRLLTFLPDLFVENNWASFRLPHYAGAMKSIYLLYFVPLFALTLLLHKWKPFDIKSNVNKQSQNSFLARSLVIIFLVLISIVLFHPFSAPVPDGRLRVDFLDVGQGDSALVTFPGGETLLVDGGGKMNFKKLYLQSEYEDEPQLFEPDRQNIGETVVSSYLWEKGYDKIDYILATHADTDHIQGLTDIARNFRVQGAMFGIMPTNNTEFQELYTELKKRDVPIYKLSRGDTFDFSNAQVEVLFPMINDEKSGNNQSVVLRITFGKRTFLLTGDIEKETERQLLSAPQFVQSDVVKAAHHGSRTSSIAEFISATQAKLVVVSVGKSSPFGHPHKEVVERWENSGAKVITTGEEGTVSVSTDGKDLQLSTFTKNR